MLICNFFPIGDYHSCTHGIITLYNFLFKLRLYLFMNLQMHDGMFVSTPLIGRLCGATQLTDFTSRYNRMSVTFVSDGENSAAGFRATYLAMESKTGRGRGRGVG